MKIRLALPVALLIAVVLAATAHAQAPLSGPEGTSLNKVLVIGTDGTRWDLLRAAMQSGRAPNLARLARQGFGRPSLLEFAKDTVTLSEVGWASIAAGVWEDKHGIRGTKLNMDPLQATKNGYLDFLTRIENRRPRTSTFLASDWVNIGLAQNGGPIFGSAMDANYSPEVDVETIEAWDNGDELVTTASERYLRRGDPDVGFVYLGLVDETAHLAGSATPTYSNAIATTDRRIGRILRAIRARASYPFESWTILVTTDHGQRPLDEPSVISHFFDSKLERTSFVIAAGPGLGARSPKARVVDVLPTALHQIGLRTPGAWNIDGRTLSRARPPSSALAALRGPRGSRRLSFRLRPGAAARRARTVVLKLPRRVRITGVAAQLGARVNGRPAAFVRLAAGRVITIRTGGKRLRSVALGTEPGIVSAGAGRVVKVSLGGPRAARGTLAVPLRR
jgi:hypothetical protein